MRPNFSVSLQESLKSGKLQQLLDSCKTLAAVSKELGYSAHGRNTGAITIFLKANGLVFKNHTQKTQEFTTKVCIKCGNSFLVSTHDKNSSKKTTCSHLCSNTFAEYNLLRVLNKIGSAGTGYTIVAKKAGMTSCCICGESEVVDIHHLDENRDNNSVSNLAPLCPTHHAYMHRGKLDLIFERLINYLDTRAIS